MPWPKPRWGYEQSQRLPGHMESHPDLYEFLGHVDDVDVYADKEELEKGVLGVGGYAGHIMLINGRTWTRYYLTEDGAPEPTDLDVPLTFDQLCELCLLLERHGLMGPSPSHPGWATKRRSE